MPRLYYEDLSNEERYARARGITMSHWKDCEELEDSEVLDRFIDELKDVGWVPPWVKV